MSKKFYYDYFSLKNVNIEKWHDSFFWAVPRETTTQITVDFKAEQIRIVNELGNTFEGDCFLIGQIISNEFIRVVNHYLLVHRIQEAGYSIKYSDKSGLIPLLLDKNTDIVFEHEDLWVFGQVKETMTPLKNFMRLIKHNMNTDISTCLSRFFSCKSVFGLIAGNVVDRPYTKSLSNWIHYIPPQAWAEAKMADPVSPYSKKIFNDISEEYVDFARCYMQKQFGIPLPGNIAEALLAYTTSYLEHIAHVYSAIQKKVRKIRPRHLLAPTAGKTFVRALSLAVRNNGGKVTGFTHGYYICHYSSPRQALHEMATVDEFMAYSPGSVQLMQRNLALNPPPRNNPVRILHENSPVLLEQWNSWKNKPLPQEIKTVMVVELSLILEWSGFHCAESMVNYHFYYTLCKTLSDKGYNVIFKRRPKSLDWEGINIFANIPNVEIEYDLFEKPGVIDKADAVFIQYAMSSTLYWSMCTNKTVIYVDAGWEPWFPDVYELMAKRCRILHCWYDERNRQCFDKEELLNILATPPEPPNTEFLERYLFPK